MILGKEQLKKDIKEILNSGKSNEEKESLIYLLILERIKEIFIRILEYT
jgi:hypothetical protein